MSETRRRFLMWAAIGLVGVSAAGWGALEWQSFEARLRRAGPLAKAYFEAHDRAAVLAVGKAWLGVAAPGRDPSALRVALAGVIVDFDGMVGPSTVERLRERVSGDFRALRTIEVEGWTLSVTEVALAAILALTRRRARRRS